MNTLMSFAAPLFNQTPHRQDDQENHDDNQQQQSRSQKQIKSKSKPKKLSLENYLDFLGSRDSSVFTVGQIQQIQAIHGFLKKGKRKEIEEAIAAMELIDPARSTLKDKVSPDAFIALEEAIMDLGTLNWKECSITSVRTISSLNKAPVNPSEPVTKPVTKPAIRMTKKRSAATLSDFSVSLGIKSGPKESDSVSGSSSLTQKPVQAPMLTTSATSSSNNADGLALLALALDPEMDGAGKKQNSTKRKGIKRVLKA